jgi:hypothetical protein
MLMKIVDSSSVSGVIIDDIFVPFEDQRYDFKRIGFIESQNIMVVPQPLQYGIVVKAGDYVRTWDIEIEDYCRVNNIIPIVIERKLLIINGFYPRKIDQGATANSLLNFITNIFVRVELVLAFLWLFILPMVGGDISLNFMSSLFGCSVYTSIKYIDYLMFCYGKTPKLLYTLTGIIVLISAGVMCYNPMVFIWLYMVVYYLILKYYCNITKYRAEYARLFNYQKIRR